MKRQLLIMLLLLSCLVLQAQQQPSSLVDFKVYVPEVEITQGDRVQIAYVLDATNYSITSFDGGIEGCVMESYDYEKSDIAGIVHRVTIKAIYSIGGAGQLKVKPMTAVVDGQTVRSDSTVLIVKPNPQYGNQWRTATAFLKSKGVDNPCLSYKYGMETLCAFSDDVNKCFAVVVSEDYSRYVENPILAYGIGNSMWQTDNDDKDNTIYSILNRYSQQIRQLRKNNEVYKSLRPSSYNPKPEGVKPLLGSIEYGQRNPYNRYFPKERYAGKDSSCIAGCGPVALAQVLTYYHKPIDLEGECIVSTKTGKKHRIDMEDFPVSWNGSDADLASLMIDCAGSVSAEMSPYATSSSLSNFKSALVRYWKYSSQCTLVKDYYDFNVLAMIYREIDNGRPVIVSDASHIFVCDGYYQDYLHYNLGWNGYCNGFYRAMVVPSVSSNQLPFNELLIGISPLIGDRKVEIKVKEPGTLSELLKNKLPQAITTLTVTGIIDGDDIAFLRNLAGALPIFGRFEDGHGMLMNLDLSGATISGGKSYFLQKADGLILQGDYSDATGSHSYKYNMSNISDSDWNTIVQLGFNKLENAQLLRGTDGHCYTSYIVQDNIIGDHMFEDCDNLTTIILPRNVEKIGKYSFHNCKSLITVKNRPIEVSDNAFQNCRFIE